MMTRTDRDREISNKLSSLLVKTSEDCVVGSATDLGIIINDEGLWLHPSTLDELARCVGKDNEHFMLRNAFSLTSMFPLPSSIGVIFPASKKDLKIGHEKFLQQIKDYLGGELPFYLRPDYKPLKLSYGAMP